MKRGTTMAKTNALLDMMREKVPGIAIRTTLIAGYPGETEEDFLTMLQWVKDQKFERLGIFAYSHEENTGAYVLEDDVPDEVKQERVNLIMEAQSEISYENNQVHVGKEFNVLVDRKEGAYYVGRTEYDSPDVDNEVLIEAEADYLRIGDFVQVKVTSATEYDLHADIAE